MSLSKVTNNSFDDINWLDHTDCDYIVKDQSIDAWRINISKNLSKLDYFAPLLNTAEIARGNKYYQTKDKNRFTISRGALRHILGLYLHLPPASIIFSTGINKKPFVENQSGIQFNISHSGDWILIAIAKSAIGVDVEFINPSFHFTDVLEDNFSIDEIKQIKDKSPIETFFKFWTRKESITKTTGKGLDENLKLIPATDGTHFVDSVIIDSIANLYISTFKLNTEYIGSIGSNSPTSNLRFWDY
ncbi:4'-phosphopantetheinyl transferase family protein [Mucilaginibacter frigoritolerans]|jgi:4'-phosphopantetheinyl transferase|nr:4'-phosphopantetheinyl transferase superfamily protein [Mucilaginibacter frigoritolerans]